MAEHDTAISEGVDVGLVGGTVVAVFFLLLDAIEGVPLRTPSVLGQTILFGEMNPNVTSPEFGAVILYTAFHFIAFALIGTLVIKLVHLGTDNPVWRFALLPGFVVFELFAYGVFVAYSEATRELFPFWTVLAANTLAAAAMGYMVWRQHPAFRARMAHAPLGVPDDDDG